MEEPLLEFQVVRVDLSRPALEMKKSFDNWHSIPEDYWFGDEGCNLRGWLVKDHTRLMGMTILPHGRPPFEVFERGNELCYVLNKSSAELEQFAEVPDLRFVLVPPENEEQ